MKKVLYSIVLSASLCLVGLIGNYTCVEAEETETETDLLTEAFPDESYTGEMEDNQVVPGKIYQFDDKNHYKFSEAETSEEAEFLANTYGLFSLSGAVSTEEVEDGVPSYGVDGGQVSLFYTYGDALLNADEEEWHLVSDKSKTVDTFKLDSDINKGAIVLQTSLDGERWVNDVMFFMARVVACASEALRRTTIQPVL